MVFVSDTKMEDRALELLCSTVEKWVWDLIMRRPGIGGRPMMTCRLNSLLTRTLSALAATTRDLMERSFPRTFRRPRHKKSLKRSLSVVGDSRSLFRTSLETEASYLSLLKEGFRHCHSFARLTLSAPNVAFHCSVQNVEGTAK